MKQLLLSLLLLLGVHSLASHAVPITRNVTIDPGAVGSTLAGGTTFVLTDLVGIDLAVDTLTLNVYLADGKLLGIVGVLNAILQLNTAPSGGIAADLGQSGLFGSDGASRLLGSITNQTLQTVNLFGSGGFDLESVVYGGLTGGGVITSATFFIFESVLVKQGRELPLPSTLALVALGLMCLAWRRRAA